VRFQSNSGGSRNRRVPLAAHSSRSLATVAGPFPHSDCCIYRNGQRVSRTLGREGKHAHAPRPDLILLDLNLPKKDGREVLAELKESPALKSIPVVILTTSASEGDIHGSYQLHVNCYITKPVGLDGFLKVVKSIDSFWLSVVKLPRETRL
jgi:chemotaxis family two-component system response regulator Rcp1